MSTVVHLETAAATSLILLGAPVCHVYDVSESDALLRHTQEHLIKRWTHETPGQPTWGFHVPHGVKPDMLRSQMLYPLSYERWVLLL